MLLNLIGFNISWFGLILLGNSFMPLSLLWLWYHLYRCEELKAELKLILSITLIGIMVDNTLLFVNVLIFFNYDLIPLWLITLWASFAATIAHSLKFLEHSIALQALTGFLFPPLSYIAATNISLVTLGYSQLQTFFILGPIWAVLMVLFFYLKDTFYKQVKTNE